ncbi:MAG: hypothetical protein DRN12_06580, partial [Thermoplasmata archaeon]
MYYRFILPIALLILIVNIDPVIHSDPIQDLIIGDDDPYEVFYIRNTTFNLLGNLIIINHGRLFIENSTFLVQGNILIFNNGSISSYNSTIGFLAISRWQYTINLYDNASLFWNQSNFYSNGYPNLLNSFDRSRVNIEESIFSDWLSCLISDNSSISIRNCSSIRGYTSEFFFKDYSIGKLYHIDGVINIFYIFQNDSVIDYSPFVDEYIEHFEFPGDISNIYNVNYKIIVDSCFIHSNTPVIEKGADVTLRNSESSIIIRATNSDTFNLTGLTSNTYYENWVIPVADRRIHLINFTIRNWHIHMFDNSTISISNSIVSELLCTGNSKLKLENVIYKGDSGPFWIWDESIVYAENCIFLAEDPTGLNPTTYVRDKGLLVLYESYIYTDVFIEDQGVIMLLNSETFREPILSDKSTLWFASIDYPSTCNSNASIPTKGSAFIEDGPSKTMSSFYGYQLFYASPENYKEFKPINGLKKKPVYNDILGYWDTSMLKKGLYLLKLTLWDRYNNKVNTYWKIQLNEKRNRVSPINNLYILRYLQNSNSINHNFI